MLKALGPLMVDNRCYHTKKIRQYCSCGSSICGGSLCPETGKSKHFCHHCTPEGWASHSLNSHKTVAKKEGYAPPDITVDGLVRLRFITTHCHACQAKLWWKLGEDSPHLDHNHVTGQVNGFSHRRCNFILGMINKMHRETGRDKEETVRLCRVILDSWEPE